MQYKTNVTQTILKKNNTKHIQYQKYNKKHAIQNITPHKTNTTKKNNTNTIQKYNTEH